MADPVSNNTMAPSSSPDITGGIVAQVGGQMGSPLSRHSHADGIGGLDMDSNNKDVYDSAPAPDSVSVAVSASVPVSASTPVPVSAKRSRPRSRLPRRSLRQLRRTRVRIHRNMTRQLRHRRRRRRHSRLDASPATTSGTAGPRTGRAIPEVQLSPYQAASSGTAYYHSHRILSSNLIGTASARSFSVSPTATADLLQNDLMAARYMARLADSVRAPSMFNDGPDSCLNLEDVETERLEEFGMAVRVYLHMPLDADRVGSHCVPILARSPCRLLLPHNADLVDFSSAYFAARRRGHAGFLSDCTGPLSSSTGSLSGAADPVFSNADSLSSGASSVFSDAGSLPRDFDSMLGEAGSLPGEAGAGLADADALLGAATDGPDELAMGDGDGNDVDFVWPFRDAI